MDDVAPPKPCALAEWMYDYTVYGIYADYRQTGTDTADTWLILTSFDKKKRECKREDFAKVADLSIGHNYVAELKPHIAESVEVWRAYAKKNALELAEFWRLKAKFEG